MALSSQLWTNNTADGRMKTFNSSMESLFFSGKAYDLCNKRGGPFDARLKVGSCSVGAVHPELRVKCTGTEIMTPGWVGG